MSMGAVSIAHQFIKDHVKAGDFCIDTTAGRGNDTVLLCRLVGENGKVLAFDIQPQAVESTKQLLESQGVSHIAEVVLESHIGMDKYAKADSVSCIVFNLGWLPGGDHAVSTRAETTILAIEKGLRLLAPEGVMSICIYYGKDSGLAEKDALLEYFRSLDSSLYTVIMSQFVNRPNSPPIAILIVKGI